MKLNLEILYEHLRGTMDAELMGMRQQTLHLGRPEYYLGERRAFRTGHLYLVRGEQLPPKPTVEPGAGILCIGGSVFLPYYLDSCGVIRVSGQTDRRALFNRLTEIYNRYDTWQESLQDILNTSASIRRMVERSQEILETPLFVLNANFHVLAYSGYSDAALTEREKAATWPSDNGELALSSLRLFLEHADLVTEKREPMRIDILDNSVLCVNLFLDTVYSGCLVLEYRRRPHRGGDEALTEYLARMLELALRKYSATSHGEKGSLRQGLQDMVSGLPIGAEQRWAMDNRHSRYLCAKMKFSSRLAQLPMGYMCSILEESFPDSVAFEYDGAIVCFLDTRSLETEGKDSRQAFREKILPLTASMSFDVGVSDPFEDVYSARLYYLQAASALENGKIFAPKDHFHLFQDHALTELLVNAFGQLPMEMYFPEGLRALARHDAASPVSYLDTLRVYLDNNMSITKTTAQLYLNRSTLLERLVRIRRELNVDLHDPNERLRIQILLKAMEVLSSGRNVATP